MSVSNVIYLLALIPNVFCIIKFNNLECQSFNKSRVVVNTCRLKALSRDNTALYANATLIEPIQTAAFHAQIFKKANGYKPWMFNISGDVCEYLAKKNNPAINLVYKFVKYHLVWNRYCPFEGNIGIDGLVLKTSYLQNLPAPEGEYLLAVHWYLDEILLARAKFYFINKEDYKEHVK